MVLEGKSNLKEDTPKRTKPMIWEFSGYRGIAAVRDGKWKSVRRNLKTKKPPSWELYDLGTDPAETKNLAEQYPDIVNRMTVSYTHLTLPTNREV